MWMLLLNQEVLLPVVRHEASFGFHIDFLPRLSNDREVGGILVVCHRFDVFDLLGLEVIREFLPVFLLLSIKMIRVSGF